jgi:hypothetical protein
MKNITKSLALLGALTTGASLGTNTLVTKNNDIIEQSINTTTDV